MVAGDFEMIPYSERSALNSTHALCIIPRPSHIRIPIPYIHRSSALTKNSERKFGERFDPLEQVVCGLRVCQDSRDEGFLCKFSVSNRIPHLCFRSVKCSVGVLRVLVVFLTLICSYNQPAI
jgi:hypothetical protein